MAGEGEESEGVCPASVLPWQGVGLRDGQGQGSVAEKPFFLTAEDWAFSGGVAWGAATPLAFVKP